jgi:hypothetical protein
MRRSSEQCRQRCVGKDVGKDVGNYLKCGGLLNNVDKDVSAKMSANKMSAII